MRHGTRKAPWGGSESWALNRFVRVAGRKTRPETQRAQALPESTQSMAGAIGHAELASVGGRAGERGLLAGVSADERAISSAGG